MKVALYNVTTTVKIGGVETFVWDLAKYLTRKGLDVHVIGGRGAVERTDTGARVLEHRYLDRAVLRRVPLLRRQYTFAKLLERLTFAPFALPSLLRERYDIIHIQKPYDLPLALLLRKLRGTRVVFGCHGKDFFWGDTILAPLVDTAVSCSQFNAKTVSDRYGIHPAVVYNGFDANLFQPTPVDKELRQSLCPGGEQVLLYVGRLVPWKGVQYLIDAMVVLKERPPVRLLILGSGPAREDLEERAREKGIADRVTFVGNVAREELPRYYALSDVVVGTSFANETFGIALCEAMACSRPVVASNFGGFREVVEEGVTGFLVPPQDSTALAEKISLLLEDQELRRRFGEAGKKRVSEVFTWEMVAERVCQAYAEVMAE